MRPVLALGISTTAHANCDPGGLDDWRAWPEGGSTGVPTNTHVLVNVFGTPAYVSRGPTIVLVGSDGSRIPTTAVLDLASGTIAMQQRTLVLRPVRALGPNVTYTLEETGAPTRTTARSRSRPARSPTRRRRPRPS